MGKAESELRSNSDNSPISINNLHNSNDPNNAE